MPPTADRNEDAVVQVIVFVVLLATSAIVLAIAQCFGCISARERDACLSDCAVSGCNALAFSCV
jgi:hypothetical protein